MTLRKALMNVLEPFGKRRFLVWRGSKAGALAAQVQDEGAKSFVKSWKELLAVIAAKSDALQKAK